MVSYNDPFELNFFGERYPLPQVEADSQTKEMILLHATVLFAKRGYSSVSMRDISDAVSLKAASLYNHFASKEVLWREVLRHARKLYVLYFNHLDGELGQAESFDEMMEAIFSEPKKLANVFTCYAFTMIMSEQFHDYEAGEIFTGTFLEYSINFFQNWFEKSIADGMVPPFDTRMVATVIMHSTLIGLEVKVQEYLGRSVPYDPSAMFADLQRFLYRTVMQKGMDGK